jgi:flavin reductase (DIM6/NTAB) family NADH-FMN oxidoreductase RutF
VAVATECFARGVTVVTASVCGRLRGMTAGSFTVVSAQPLLVLVAIRRGSTMLSHILAAGAFAVSVLADEQAEAAQWFASSERPQDGQFELVAWRPGPVTGAPVLDDALAFADCRVQQVLAAGDHELVLGQVLAFRRNSERRAPLVRFGREYVGLALTAGAAVAS